MAKEQVKETKFNKFVSNMTQSLKSHKKDCVIIDNHVVDKKEEYDLLLKLIDTRADCSFFRWSNPMKRLICLARAVLEKPEILLVEEKAFIIDHTKRHSYLDGIFSSLRETTILCDITSFKLLDRFEQAAVFDSNSIIERGLTQDLLQTKESALVEKLKTIDSRKVGVMHFRKKSILEVAP